MSVVYRFNRELQQLDEMGDRHYKRKRNSYKHLPMSFLYNKLKEEFNEVWSTPNSDVDQLIKELTDLALITLMVLWRENERRGEA